MLSSPIKYKTAKQPQEKTVCKPSYHEIRCLVPFSNDKVACAVVGLYLVNAANGETQAVVKNEPGQKMPHATRIIADLSNGLIASSLDDIYTIEIRDEAGNLLNTLTGHTDSDPRNSPIA